MTYYADTHADTSINADDHALVEPITGWHAFNGLPLGLVPAGDGISMTQINVTEVLEQSSDLAIADRAAWVLARRTGHNFVVLSSDHGYLVVMVDQPLDWADATRLQRYEYSPHVVSVAFAEGVMPVMMPTAV